MPVSRLFVAALAVFATVVPGSAVAAAGRAGSVTPNDPYYSEQRDFQLARLPQAWKLGKGASSQIIAIVDGSMRTSHPDLRGRIVAGYSVPNDGPRDATDSAVDPSATEVAGIAAADTNNRKGVAGAAWKARIMPVRVTDPQNRRMTDSDLIRGITWAANHGATIINVSLAASGPSTALHDAVKYATRKGALVVAPAGNTVDFTPPDVATYPAAYPEVLAVGATTVDGHLSPLSAWGDWVDLAAPSDQMTTTSGSGGYVTLDGGAAYAAALVSGVAALVRARYPKLSPAQVAERLTTNAREAGPQGIDPYFGAGIVDAYAALGGPRATAIPVAAPGLGEPNDTPARATPLTGSAKSTFYVEGDVDWYRFTATSEAWTSVSVAPTKGTSDSDPDIMVYDSDLRQVGVGATVLSDHEQLTLRTRPGIYYLQVRQSRTQHTDGKPFTVSVGPARVTPAFHAPLVRPGGGRYQEVIVADVTGDARLDAVVMSDSRGEYPRQESLIVHPQMSDGTLGPAATYPLSGDHGIAVLDVTGDGRKDVVNRDNGRNYVYAQKPDGTLAVPVSETNVLGVGRPTAADIDSDGDEDVVMTWNDVRVLRQDTPGAFTASALDSADLGSPQMPVVADLDSNGRSDITVAGDTKIATFYQGADGGWSRQTWPNPWASNSTLSGLGTGNFGGDEAIQFVAVVHHADDSGEVLIMRPTAGAANLAVTQRIKVPDAGPLTGEPQALITDLTNDGRTDVLLDAGGFVRTYVQQPGGKLVPELSRDLIRHTMPYTAGDIDGDGRTDLLTGDLAGLIVQHAAAGPPVPGDPAWLRDIAPAPGAVGVSTTAPVSVTFRRPIDPASVNAVTVRLVDERSGKQAPSAISYSAETRTVTVTPDKPLIGNQPHRLWLGDIRDSDGDRYPVSSSGFLTARSG